MQGRIQHFTIDNIVNAIANLRQGDYLFLDIKNTLLYHNIDQTQVSATEKELAQQIKILRESGIHVIGLVECDMPQLKKTDLQTLGYDLEEVIHALPVDEKQTKAGQTGN